MRESDHDSPTNPGVPRADVQADAETEAVDEKALPSFGERYQVIQKLAEGGMAEVFLARDAQVSPPKLVVIKRILPGQGKNPEYLKMFHDEGRLGLSLAHPNIVKLFEVARSSSGPFIVMEYLAGQDLFDLVRRARRNGSYVPWPLAVAVAAQAAEGVAYAHALKGSSGAPLNVIHRDLTPSNIFVTWDGVVKVLDFGIARAEQRLAKTQAGMVKGKAQYLAPEQITGKADIDGRVDQFSLAAVLYEILSGELMFKADNELAALNAILEGPRPSIHDLRPDIPVEVDAVILRATQIKREARFADMREFAQALRTTLPADAASREAIAGQLRLLFPTEFEAHAELMGRLQSPGAPDELRALYNSARAHDPVELPPLPTGQFEVGPTEVVVEPDPTPRGLFIGAAVLVALLVVAIGVKVARRPPPPLPTGTLVVHSDPPGASVVLDGHPTTWTTPFVQDHIALGRHHIEMNHDQRGAYVGDFELTAQAPTYTLDATLALVPGSISLRVSPPVAKVSFDKLVFNIDRGVIELRGTAGETHRLTVEAPGFRTVTMSVEPDAKRPAQLTVTLEPELTEGQPAPRPQ